MTPGVLDAKIESILAEVQKPSRYIGGEVNEVVKPTATVRVALCYPDAYEIGISNQALQILYTLVNAQPEAAPSASTRRGPTWPTPCAARAFRCSPSSRGGRCASSTCSASRCRPS